MDAELDAAYPQDWGAEVTVTTDSGARIAQRVTGARGDPENPLSDSDIAAKVASLCSFGGLEASRAARLIAECYAMITGGIPELPWIDS